MIPGHARTASPTAGIIIGGVFRFRICDAEMFREGWHPEYHRGFLIDLHRLASFEVQAIPGGGFKGAGINGGQGFAARGVVDIWKLIAFQNV